MATMKAMRIHRFGGCRSPWAGTCTAWWRCAVETVGSSVQGIRSGDAVCVLPGNDRGAVADSAVVEATYPFSRARPAASGLTGNHRRRCHVFVRTAGGMRAPAGMVDMAQPDKHAIVRVVLERHPRSHADLLGIDVARNTPAPLYQWLLASLLFSARISAEAARKAALALFEQGWRTPRRMAATGWDARVRVLNRAGYARYDESTARYIGDTTATLQDRYGGDLRRLRAAADGDPARIRTLLKDFKGIGEVGADIFCREVQVPWDELYPSADRRALETAGRLGLGDSADGLAALVGRRDFPRLVAALTFVERGHEIKAIRQEAAGGQAA